MPDAAKCREPIRRRAATWLYLIGSGAIVGGAAGLWMSHPRYWPLPHWLDWALIAAGILALFPWLVTVVYRDHSWLRAYRRGRVSRNEFLAYRDRRTGWPRTSPR